MVATTFDKYHILTRKYDGAEENKDACKRAGAIVLHNIDATKLDLADFDDMSGFHRIVLIFHMLVVSISSQIKNCCEVFSLLRRAACTGTP